MATPHAEKSLAYLITGLSYGGAEIQLLKLTPHLQRMGWRICVISMTEPSTLVNEFSSLTIPVYSLAMSKSMPDPRGLLRLFSLLRKIRPRILHAHLFHSILMARIARLFRRLPTVICTAHNIEAGGAMRRLAYRATDSLADLTTNVSQAAVDRFIEQKLISPEKARLVYNGVDTSAFARNSFSRNRMRGSLGLDNQFVWLAVGSLSAQKDYPIMLKAFSDVCRNRDQCLLYIVGDGPMRGAIEKKICELSLEHTVKLLGNRSNISEFMSAADGYVMSSAWEGLPMVLLEASACELPIVATDVGGNREIVDHLTTGFLLPARDATTLSHHMIRMVDTPVEDRKSMGRLARQHIMDTFSIEAAAATWNDIYEQLFHSKDTTH